MNLSRHKKLLWVIAFWFAFLQAVAPFIHGHLDSDQSSHTHDMHVHDDDHDHAFSQQAGHFIHDSEHVAHTIVVATGIKKDMDGGGFAVALLVLAFIFLPFKQPVAASPRFAPLFRPLFRRRPSSPRAPPLR